MASERTAATLVFAVWLTAGLSLTIPSVLQAARRAVAPSPFLRSCFVWLLLLGCYMGPGVAFESPGVGVVVLAATGCAALAVWAGRPRGASLRENGVRGALATLLVMGAAALPPARAMHLPWRSSHGLSAAPLVLFDLGLLLFLVARPLEDVGFRLELRARELGLVALAFAIAVVDLAPLGLGVGFIRYGPVFPDAWGTLVLATTVFLRIALPEEFVFRGLLQRGLERAWRGHPRRALLVASAIFGLAHAVHRPWPNWRYALLAAFAGLVYGWVWRRTRALGASALVHAAVDFTWVTVFHG